MIINKPLFHIINHNDINYIEINEVKNKKNNKNINKKMTEEIDEDEIIENYPYEFWEDEINDDNRKDKELKYIISDTEPQPEPGQEVKVNIKNANIDIDLNKNKEKNDEDVIDFDEESIFITNDKTEENNLNVNMKDIELNKKKDINLENINQINLNINTEKKFLRLSDILDEEQNKIDDSIEIIKDKKASNVNNKQIIRTENENNNIIIQNDNKKNDSNKENILNNFLDQEEIMDILNLNKEKNSLEEKGIKNGNIPDEEISKIFLNKTSTKKLLQDLYEKEMKFKNAYAEYYTKLSETMNTNYFKEILENSNNANILNKDNIIEKNKTNIDYLIHKNTNTRNDINIFCLNNNNGSNNYLNFNNNEPKSQTFEIRNYQNLSINNINNLNTKSHESFPLNGQKQNINIDNKHSAYEEYKNSKLAKNSTENDKTKKNNDYIRHPTIILSIRKFLNEYNISVQNRALVEFSKNPSLNYESYIDILKDLNYIDQRKLPQIYFINISIYRQIWNFLVNIKNDIQSINGEEFILESNLLLLFLLLLNGFFNNVKIIDELEIELSWLNFDNYEKLILKYDYIEQNFKELINIRKNNILSKSNSNNNLLLINNNKKNYDSENKSKGLDDVLSEYFNSYTNQINNNKSNINDDSKNNIKEKNIYNYSDNKIHTIKNNKQKKINHNSIINNKLYAFKPRNNSSMKKFDINKDLSKTMKKNFSYNSLQANKSKDSNPLKSNTIDNIINKEELKKTKHLKRSKIKNKILKISNIKYNELYNLSKNKEDINDKPKNNSPNSNILTKKSSKKNLISSIILKGKTGNYSTKVKQNRTDLKKLFKNNEFKDGTINERLEKIKKNRNNSKSKGRKVQINYEEYINLDKFKEKENEKNQKHKYQFRKHTPPKKNNIIYNFKIEEKEYILEHNPEENIEIEIMQLMQKNNIIGISAKSILEKIKK